MLGFSAEVPDLPDHRGVQDLAVARDGLLSRIIDHLKADRRVQGSWLTGSFGRDEVDAWSDLDLQIAVSDDSLEAFLADRTGLYAAVGEPVLVQDEMSSDSLDAAVFQLVWYAGGVEVDWNIGPASRARKSEGHRMLFERRPFEILSLPALTEQERAKEANRQLTFFWAMTPITIKYAARRDIGKTVEMIRMLTTAFLRIAHLVHEPCELTAWQPSLTNRPLAGAIEERIPRLGETADPVSACEVIEQLCDEVRLLEPALVEFGATTRPSMRAETWRMLTLCRGTLTGEPPERRRYR